jgi:hypothetical protein
MATGSFHRPREESIMKRRITAVALLVCFCAAAGCTSEQTTEDKLREWRKGVWMLAGGSYAIYTDNHYFVVSLSGDSTSTNLYCGASQLRFCEKGMARHQTIRVRKFPGGDLACSKKAIVGTDQKETPLEIDESQFEPGTCNIVDGVIYDSVTEVTDEYILLSTCNGDREKIYSDGRSAYLPAGGGEFYAHRIESF